MSNLKNEIKNRIEDFKQPMNQSIKNLKDNVNDTVNDSVEEIREKGRSGKIIFIIIVCLLIGMISNHCSKEDSSENVASNIPQTADNEIIDATETVTTEVFIEHLRLQIEYANNNNIKLNRFPKEEKALANFLENVDTLEINLTCSSKKGIETFRRTENRGDYIYYGELKDNKPNGYGILFKRSDIAYGAIISNDEYYYNRYYIGAFKNGKFEGYGLLFDIEESSIYPLIDHCPYPEDSDQFYNYYLDWENPVAYFGMFLNGQRSGLGNYFSVFNIENFNENNSLDIISYPIIETGEFEGEYLNGVGKIYYGTYLYYDGELKDGVMHGVGKRFYFLSNNLEYEGGFKNDKRNGYGISYSENGEIVYEGNWKNDDYA